MKTNRRQFSNDANEVAELERKAKAMILYDDLSSMLAAQQLLTRLEPDGNRRADWMVNLWQFDTLTLMHRLEAWLSKGVDAFVKRTIPQLAETLRRFSEMAWAILPIVAAASQEENVSVCQRCRLRAWRRVDSPSPLA